MAIVIDCMTIFDFFQKRFFRSAVPPGHSPEPVHTLFMANTVRFGHK
ncbi:MAG: hypothetical protein JSW66_12785 [Phycisphaerales bacterium]|nr:MAG: hypothetical protein JSW66_12785 [Phycisphaerales bacterium]